MGPPKLEVFEHSNPGEPHRPPHCTITPAVVRSAASGALREAPRRGYGRRVPACPSTCC
jgi:hypothetical protein